MSKRAVAMAAIATMVAAGGLIGGTAAAAPVVGTGPCASDPPVEHESVIPEKLNIPIPYPWVEPVPFPAPETDPVRITPEPLPADPCSNPCPDLTDVPDPPGGLSSRIGIPEIGLDFNPFVFGIPVPGAEQQLPDPPSEVTPPAEPAPLSPKRATPQVREVSMVQKVTGASSTNRTDKRWQVNGTDLGIMWESQPGEVAVAFGDTVGRGFHPPGGQGDDWRSNVLGFSTDANLADGLTIDKFVQDSRCHAAEVLSSRKIDNVEITTIPTSGFAIGSRQYMSYMSIRTWNSIPTTWFTNHGGIAFSDDGGQTWTKDPYARWDNIFGLGRFQVAAMVPQGGYVYMFGTPNTRLGEVALARVPEADVLNKSAYQYWSDGEWTPVGGPRAATPIIRGTAGELSVDYDDARGVWRIGYLDTLRTGITLRESDAPQGTWSEPVRMVGVESYPELYGGFIHPWSTAEDLYFTISTWSDYNVFLMRAELD